MVGARPAACAAWRCGISELDRCPGPCTKNGRAHRYSNDELRATDSSTVSNACFVAGYTPRLTGTSASVTGPVTAPYSQHVPATTVRITPAFATTSNNRIVASTF